MKGVSTSSAGKKEIMCESNLSMWHCFSFSPFWREILTTHKEMCASKKYKKSAPWIHIAEKTQLWSENRHKRMGRRRKPRHKVIKILWKYKYQKEGWQEAALMADCWRGGGGLGGGVVGPRWQHLTTLVKQRIWTRRRGGGGEYVCFCVRMLCACQSCASSGWKKKAYIHCQQIMSLSLCVGERVFQHWLKCLNMVHKSWGEWIMSLW